MPQFIKDQNHLGETKEWRDLFSNTTLAHGQQLLSKKCVLQFTSDGSSAKAQVVDGTKVYSVAIENAPVHYRDRWDPHYFSCNCKKKSQRTYYDAETGELFMTCEHEAAVMLRWESGHGPWVFDETDAEYNHRMYMADLRRRKALLVQQKEKDSQIKLDASEFLNDLQPGGFFDVRKAIENRKTTLFAVNRAKDLIRQGTIHLTEKKVVYGKDDTQVLQCSAIIEDELSSANVTIVLGFEGIESHTCSCNPFARFSSGYNLLPLCEHELILLKNMQDIARQPNIGDATDKTALRFFQALTQPSVKPASEDKPIPEKQKTLILSPRIVIDEGNASLTFRLGHTSDTEITTKTKKGKDSSKSSVIKNLKTMVEAVEEEAEYQLTKTQVIDFSKTDFTDESLPWLVFIQRRVSEAAEVNNRLQSRYYYGYNPSLKMQDSLTGALLDQFYEIAEGGTYECVNRNEAGAAQLSVGHSNMKVHLKSEQITDREGGFLGILVTGSMPMVLQGSSDHYILGDGSLSKITREEEAILQPFHEAADENGFIRFRVGKDSLSEFYYRVVPMFLQSKYIDFVDTCFQDAQALLPPEAEFLFRMDMNDHALGCETLVTYDDKTFNLLTSPMETDGFRDILQEHRIEETLKRYFPYIDSESQLYWGYINDDFLYTILTELVPELEQYGIVQGSEKFLGLKVRSAPPIQVGVSIESGLMDISVISKDISPEELLDILNSYREKKKYHRLRSGDYIRLTQSGDLVSLESMLTDIDLKPEDVIGRQAHLPVYRALYLDSMLRKHEELASNRNRTYRELVTNFAAIRDAVYETPAPQADILRPYQTYGFKWLRTLVSAGFGGILADEMGLGKTIQAITLLQSLKDENLSGVSLIVCPASLVYNWLEEFHRFSPDLSVEVIAGTAPQRKEQIAKQHADVLITSYDLFRKDVVLYKDTRFTVMILDEAQYIKNQKAAITKAVKTAAAQYRFALTGTPVENRLAELWSIFDFLMPGFLYSYQEFSERFENPIVKNHDQAASDRLKQLTSPFILRRLKADVLKDLPDKLEEVRYTRFEDEQRKVYDGQVVRMKQMIEGISGKGEDKIKILAELMRIRQICCDPSLLFDDYHGGSAKREACLELVQSAVGGGHRMLIFSQFTSMLALLEEDLKREGISYMKLIGSTPKDQRIRMVREFNEGDTPVFLISLKAGGTGLNLTGADMVIHYDPWWNIAAQNQATDRAHRIGQTNTVTVYRLIVKDSIEEKILDLQEAKRDLADSILSGDQNTITSLSPDELLDLLS